LEKKKKTVPRSCWPLSRGGRGSEMENSKEGGQRSGAIGENLLREMEKKKRKPAKTKDHLLGRRGRRDRKEGRSTYYRQNKGGEKRSAAAKEFYSANHTTSGNSLSSRVRIFFRQRRSGLEKCKRERMHRQEPRLAIEGNTTQSWHKVGRKKNLPWRKSFQNPSRTRS